MRTPFILGLFGLLLLLVAVACEKQTSITSFEACVAAGNPVMESYPRQCSADGQTFAQEVDEEHVSGEEPSLSSALFHECTAEEKQAEICTFQYDPVCALVDNGVRCIT